MSYPKLYIAPISAEIITAAAKICNDYKENPIGFITSENQVGINGYTGFTNESLIKFLNTVFSRPPIIARDHSSCYRESLAYDCKTGFNGIHIDPFKNSSNDVFAVTRDSILFCETQNSNLFYEISTEEGVFPFNDIYLESFLSYLSAHLPDKIFEKIKYVVIQSGTLLHNGKNCSSIDYGMLTAMNKICQRYGKISKGHNFDYVDNKIISKKINLCAGNLAVNIAPEIAFVQSSTIWDSIDRYAQNEVFNLVANNKQTQRWFSKDYDISQNKRLVSANIMHYLFQVEAFKNSVSKFKVKEEVEANLLDWIQTKLAAVGT